MTGAVVWVMGRPSSGKTTLAHALSTELALQKVPCCLLDGDVVRALLRPTPGYDEASRLAFYETLCGLSVELCHQGLIVIVAATAHRSVYRAAARARASRYLEVLVDTPLTACEARDAKGLYAAARKGSVHSLPGVQDPFEFPLAPHVIASGGYDQQALSRIITMLRTAPSHGEHRRLRIRALRGGIARAPCSMGRDLRRAALAGASEARTCVCVLSGSDGRGAIRSCVPPSSPGSVTIGSRSPRSDTKRVSTHAPAFGSPKSPIAAPKIALRGARKWVRTAPLAPRSDKKSVWRSFSLLGGACRTIATLAERLGRAKMLVATLQSGLRSDKKLVARSFQRLGGNLCWIVPWTSLACVDPRRRRGFWHQGAPASAGAKKLSRISEGARASFSSSSFRDIEAVIVRRGGAPPVVAWSRRYG